MTLAVAATWAAAALLWLAAGPALPGGRWVAVHLFTLGVLTNLLVDLTRHFGATLLHTRDDVRHLGLRITVRNASIVAVLAGRGSGHTSVFAVGAATLSAEVFLGWRDVRRIRRSALPARHAPLVRAYQRAYGAFLHAGLLGLLMGTGLLEGDWYAAARVAHLHIAVLGWVGVPLLATLVFLGPTVLRTRSGEAADRHAVRMLPLASTGATTAALGLLLSGLGGRTGDASRIAAGFGVALFAAATTVICRDVLLVVRRAAAPNPALTTALAWLMASAWLDAVVVLTGRTAYLDVVGAMALIGGIAPLVAVAGSYLWAMSGGVDAVARAQRLRTVARWSMARAALWHGGCAAVVATMLARALGAGEPTWPARVGLTLVAVSGAASLALVATHSAVAALRGGRAEELPARPAATVATTPH